MTSKSDGKRPLGFVNRRGNSADISAKELNELSIDTQPTASDSKTLQTPSKTTNKGEKPDKSTPRRKQRRRFRWSRKYTIVTIAIIALIVVVPIVIGEIMRAQYDSSTESAQSSVQKIIKEDVMPLQQKADVSSKQMSEVTSKLEAVRDDMCPGGIFDNASKLYPRSQTAYDDCIAQRGKIAGVTTQMRDMTNILAYIEGINAALAPVVVPLTDEFAVTATQQSNWQQVTAAIEKINPPTQMKPSYDQLIAGARQVTDGWSKLNTANNSQDAAAFRAAETQLADGYTAISASNDAAKLVVSEKQTELSQQAVKLN